MDVITLVTKVRDLIAAVTNSDWILAFQIVRDLFNAFVPQTPVRLTVGSTEEAEADAAIAELQALCDSPPVMSSHDEKDGFGPIIIALLPIMLELFKKWLSR